MTASWQIWALASAAFAALTAIFAKIGVTDVDSDFATLVRTVVILTGTLVIVTATGQFQPLGSVSRRTYGFLVLSGLATGGSWLCYFRALKLGDAARVAPIDKLSVVLVAIFATAPLGERLSIIGWIGVSPIAGGAVLLATSRLRSFANVCFRACQRTLQATELGRLPKVRFYPLSPKSGPTANCPKSFRCALQPATTEANIAAVFDDLTAIDGNQPDQRISTPKVRPRRGAGIEFRSRTTNYAAHGRLLR